MIDSQSRVHRLVFQGEDAEDALMHSSQWLVTHETLQPLDAESELADSGRTLASETARSKPRKVLVRGVFRAVDDPQVLSTPAFHSRLGEASFAAQNEAERFDHHAFATALGVLGPPVDALRFPLHRLSAQ
jgi:hypothetical protein